MKESINLIGTLLGHVCQHDLFKCVQILNMPNLWDEKFKWLNTYTENKVWYSFVEHKQFNYLHVGKLMDPHEFLLFLRKILQNTKFHSTKRSRQSKTQKSHAVWVSMILDKITSFVATTLKPNFVPWFSLKLFSYILNNKRDKSLDLKWRFGQIRFLLTLRIKGSFVFTPIDMIFVQFPEIVQLHFRCCI